MKEIAAIFLVLPFRFSTKDKFKMEVSSLLFCYLQVFTLVTQYRCVADEYGLFQICIVFTYEELYSCFCTVYLWSLCKYGSSVSFPVYLHVWAANCLGTNRRISQFKHTHTHARTRTVLCTSTRKSVECWFLVFNSIKTLYEWFKIPWVQYNWI
jgi:hypothetical protein